MTTSYPVRFEFQGAGAEELAQAFRDLAAAVQVLENGGGELSESMGRVAAAEAEAATESIRLARALAEAKREEDKATRGASDLEKALGAQISGWGTLGTAVGQVGAVLGRVAPEFSQFGAVLGQTGQSIQAVVTALASPNPASITSALISVTATAVDALSALESYNDGLESVTVTSADAAASVRDLAAAFRESNDAQRIRSGIETTTDEIAGAIATQRDAVRELEAQRNRAVGIVEDALPVIGQSFERFVEEARRDTIGITGAAADAARALDDLDRRIRQERTALQELQSLSVTDGPTGRQAGSPFGLGGADLGRLAEQAEERERRREARRRAGAGSAEARRREEQEALQRSLQDEIEFARQREAAEVAAANQIAQVRSDLQRTLNELDASNLERTKANARRRIEILEDEADRTAEVRRTAIERERQLAELNEGGQFIPQSQVDRLLADYDRIEARRQELTQALIAARSVEEADAIQRQIRANEREQDAAEFRQGQLERLTEEARAKSEEIEATSAGILQPVLSGITSAIADVISGARSAEEAFQALLSSFLQSIAERAAVEAAAEYAAAIGAFARYDYASGGQHLAAGVAWTGVAIAAGVGAAVTAPAEASATAPADPGGFGGGNGDGGGTVVVNFSGPVVTASTEAELGDNINRLIGQSNARAA